MISLKNMLIFVIPLYFSPVFFFLYLLVARGRISVDTVHNYETFLSVPPEGGSKFGLRPPPRWRQAPPQNTLRRVFHPSEGVNCVPPSKKVLLRTLF